MHGELLVVDGECMAGVAQVDLQGVLLLLLVAEDLLVGRLLRLQLLLRRLRRVIVRVRIRVGAGVRLV